MFRDSEYLVSIRLMTYNHAAYIEDALNGIFIQETDYKIEVVIGDDYSTDDTLNIIKKYIVKNNKDNIVWKVLERERGDEYYNNRQKLGRLYNFYNILENCSGKYIALLDGDDYWNDENKIKEQVDFLERNNDYSICFHKSDMYNELDKTYKEDYLNDNTNEYCTQNEILKSNPIRTLSAMIKKDSIKVLFNVNNRLLFSKSIPGDWIVYSLATQNNNKAKYLNKSMGVYRVSNDGLWSNTTNIIDKYLNEIINGYYFLYRNIDFKSFNIISDRYLHNLGYRINKNRKENDYRLFVKNKLYFYYIKTTFYLRRKFL